MSFVSHRRSRSSLIRGDAKIWNSMEQCPEAVQPRQIQALNMMLRESRVIFKPGDFRTESEITKACTCCCRLSRQRFHWWPPTYWIFSETMWDQTTRKVRRETVCRWCCLGNHGNPRCGTRRRASQKDTVRLLALLKWNLKTGSMTRTMRSGLCHSQFHHWRDHPNTCLLLVGW